MALTQLADVVVPEIVMPEMALRINEKSAFMGSGVIFNDTVLGGFAGTNFGLHIDLPKYNHIANGEPNGSTDDPSDVATPQKNTQVSVLARKLMYNNGWSSADLVYALSQPNPEQVVAEQLGDYWAQVIDRVAIATMLGIFNDNGANNAGDMAYDISTDVDAPVEAAQKISLDAFVKANGTLGDNSRDTSIVTMHSVVHQQCIIDNQIITVPASDTSAPYDTYLGHRVVISDENTVIAGTYRNKYITVISGANALRYGEGAPKTPLAHDRKEDQANGEGIETIWSRKHFVLAPTNYSWDQASAVVAGGTPTLAEIATATSWDRTVPRKDVKIAFLVTNG